MQTKSNNLLLSNNEVKIDGNIVLNNFESNK